MDHSNVREQRLKLSSELFTLLFQDSNVKSLSDEQKKEFIADFITERLQDERLIKFFQGEQQMPFNQSIHISDEEIAQTILTVGGKTGYEESQSSLPYELWLQSQTPTYKRHFGNVEPKRFYHGTSQDFLVFDDETIQSKGRGDLFNNFGNAHYFTPNEDFAKSYGKNLKTVLVDDSNFIDVSQIYISREQEEIKKDQSFLLFLAMCNEALAKNNRSKLLTMTPFVNSIAFQEKAITDMNVLLNLDNTVYKAAGFEGVIWNKDNGRDEVVSFSAKNILHAVTREKVDHIEGLLKMVNKNEVQAYVLCKNDLSEAYIIAADLPTLDELGRDRFDLNDNENVAAFLKENDVGVRVINHLPIKDLVEIKHRSILATSDTMLNALRDNAHVANLRQEIEDYESMAEVVVRVCEGETISMDKIGQIIRDEMGPQIKEPYYKMTSKGEDKNYIILPDGSEIDKRGGVMKANANIEERIDAIEKQYRHNYAQRVNADVKLARDYFAEVRVEIKEQKSYGHGMRR